MIRESGTKIKRRSTPPLDGLSLDNLNLNHRK